MLQQTPRRDLRSLIPVALLTLATAVGAAQPAPEAFLYLSNRRIITVELTGPRSAILNYINLGDSIEVLEARDVLVVDEADQPYRGHLFLDEEAAPGSVERFQPTRLVEPGQFSGYDVAGKFLFQAPPRDAYLRLGARLIQLEPLTAEDFEVVADKIGNLDLSNTNRKGAIIEAGFWQGHGEILDSESEMSRALNRVFPESDTMPPVLLEQPSPRLPARFGDLEDPVVVRLRVQVTSLGGVVGIEVSTGIHPELDEIAINAVRNSWVFLPAVADGKPSGSEVVVRVPFQR